METRLCVIGYGWMGKLLAQAASELRGVNIVGIADPALHVGTSAVGKGMQLANDELAPTYRDYVEMLKQQHPDAVIVGSKWTKL